MSDLYTVEVVIPIPLSQTFDYMVSKLEFENIKKGSRVIVSFGHKKLYTAIVVKKFINKQYDFNPLISQKFYHDNQIFRYMEWINKNNENEKFFTIKLFGKNFLVTVPKN